eukprot:c14686_g1_i1 orf=429-704(+)
MDALVSPILGLSRIQNNSINHTAKILSCTPCNHAGYIEKMQRNLAYNVGRASSETWSKHEETSSSCLSASGQASWPARFSKTKREERERER